MANKTPVCPHCGGRKSIKQGGYYKCPDCRNDFGRQAVSDDGLPMVEAVKGLRYRHGSPVSGSVWLLMGEDETGDCLYEVYNAEGGGADKYADIMTNDQWKSLKKKLFEEFYVHDWQKNYHPVNDGQNTALGEEWKLTLIVNDHEDLEIEGFGAYPVYWKSFTKLLKPFFDQLNKK